LYRAISCSRQQEHKGLKQKDDGEIVPTRINPRESDDCTVLHRPICRRNISAIKTGRGAPWRAGRSSGISSLNATMAPQWNLVRQTQMTHNQPPAAGTGGALSENPAFISSAERTWPTSG
jgi:hypothetical protein